MDFNNFYKNHINNISYNIDYGSRKGCIKYNPSVDGLNVGVKYAADQYNFNADPRYTVGINNQFGINGLNSNDLLVLCIEIFDWGGVQKSNIIQAIDLHRKGSLTQFLLEYKKWFESDCTLDVNQIIFPSDFIWSSGWTKVYSFTFSHTAMYDSRVAAFINYIMLSFYDDLKLKGQEDLITPVTEKLVSFGGDGGRIRVVNSEYKVMLASNGTTNKRKCLIANKLASWLLRYITEEIEFQEQSVSQSNFREIDKAMFMLGFDMSQIHSAGKFFK